MRHTVGVATATDEQLAKQLERMRAIAMALPEATEEVTWGTDINFRVRKKIFCFPATGGSLTVKAEREELPGAARRRAVLPGAATSPAVAGCAWTCRRATSTGTRSPS